MKSTKNQYNYKSTIKTKEKFTEPTQTVPNQAYTVQELLKMHIQGMVPPVNTEAIYEDEIFEEEFNPLRKQNFDLSDTDEIRDSINNLKDHLEKQEKVSKKAVKKAEKQKIINDYEEQKQQQQQQQKETDKKIKS